MENTGRVRNILVNNYYEFEEVLMKKLAYFEINYVKLGNEIHFFDRIYRFYDVKKDRKEILEKEEFIKNECTICTPLDLICLRDRKSIEEYFKKFDGEININVTDDILHFGEIEYRPKKKNDIRKNNIDVKKKIKKKIFSNKPVNCRRGK